MAELERRELEARARLMLPAQRAARLREVENMVRLKGIMGEPYDPEVTAEGLARAREALREGLREKVS